MQLAQRGEVSVEESTTEDQTALGKNTDIQLLKKRRVAVETFENSRGVKIRVDGQGFKSMQVGYCQRKLLVINFIDSGRFQAEKIVSIGCKCGSCRCSQSPTGSTTRSGT